MAMDLVGLTDIADRLGVKKTTPQVWRHRGVMPEPLAVVNGYNPVWHWRTIQAWAESTGRCSALPDVDAMKARAHELWSEASYAHVGYLAAPTSSGEWDWFRSLHHSEQARLLGKSVRTGRKTRRAWCADGMAPDQLAEAMGRGDDIEGACLEYVRLSRIVDLASALLAGRKTDPAAFGGETPESMFGVAERPAEPDRLAACRIGACPADMTYEAWQAECEALRPALDAAIADVDEFGSHWANVAWARGDELMPLGVGDGLTGRRLFNAIVRAYRAG